MDLKDQLRVTWDNGILEGNFTHEKHYFLLYKVFEFFVEVAFDAGTDDIIGLSSFS